MEVSNRNMECFSAFYSGRDGGIEDTFLISSLAK